MSEHPWRRTPSCSNAEYVALLTEIFGVDYAHADIQPMV